MTEAKSKKPQKPSRKHHFVPQCYLRGFGKTNNKNKTNLFKSDVKTFKATLTTTKAVCSQNDYYTVDIEKQPQDVVEKKLSNFEGTVAVVLKRLRGKPVFQTKDDFEIILNFIAYLDAYGPDKRDMAVNALTKTANKIISMLVSSKNLWEKYVKDLEVTGFKVPKSISFEQVRKFAEKENHKIVVDKLKILDVAGKQMKVILQCLAARKWMMAITNEKTGYFVTSDCPVVLNYTDSSENNSISPGHGLNNTYILFPVMKELCLLGTFEKGLNKVINADRELNKFINADRELNKFINADRELVASVNSDICSSADRHVFSYDKDFIYMKDDGKICHSSELQVHLS